MSNAPEYTNQQILLGTNVSNSWINGSIANANNETHTPSIKNPNRFEMGLSGIVCKQSNELIREKEKELKKNQKVDSTTSFILSLKKNRTHIMVLHLCQESEHSQGQFGPCWFYNHKHKKLTKL